MSKSKTNIRLKVDEFLRKESKNPETVGSLSTAKRLIKQLLLTQSGLEDENNRLQLLQQDYEHDRAFYQDIINNHPAGVYRIRVKSMDDWDPLSWVSSLNPPYVLEYASKRFSDILGVTTSQFKKNVYILSDLIIPEDKASFAKENEIANSTISPFRWEGRLLVRKKIKWVRVESFPLRLGNKEIRWTGILYDITKSRNIEDELNSTKVKLEEVLSGANIGTMEWNIQTGKIKFNDIWAQNLGYNPIELKIGASLFGPTGWKMLTHPSDIAYVDEMLQRHFSGEMPDYVVEVRMRHKKGHWVWMRHVGKVKVWTSDGKPLLMYGVHTNIDDRKISEIELSSINNELEKRVMKRNVELEKLNSELLLSERKSKTISDFTYDWEYWQYPDKKIVFMSPSVLRITGYTIAEFEANSELLNDIIFVADKDVWDSHSSNRTEDTKEGDSEELIFRIVTKKGEIRWISHVCRLVYIDSKYLGVRVSNRDITEKMNADKDLLEVTINVEEKERNKFSRELHDGMGPLLATIKLYFQWLSENEDLQKKVLITEKGNQCIEAAIQTSRELSRGLSSQLLTQSGYVIAIEDFIQRINDVGVLDVKFMANISKRFNQFLEVALYRITTELLKNTITYANASKVEISVYFNKYTNSVSLSYSDNGIGFDYEAIRTTHTGLGLMNIQQRVHILKGTIQIQSSINNGMKVNLKFPAEDF